MPLLVRVILAVAALALGAAGTAGVLVFERGGEPAHEVVVLARDVPAGGEIGAAALHVVNVRLPAPQRAAAYSSPASVPGGSRATHALASGQVLQLGDVAAPATADERLVLLPAKDPPPLHAGDRVDILSISGPADRPLVSLFAGGVEVRAALPQGLLLAVPARRASAVVYAAAAMRLAVVVDGAGARPGDEPPVATPEQAQELVRR